MKTLALVGNTIKKYATRTVAVFALAATFVVPASINNTYATGNNATPRFNFLSGDVEMLTAANTTQGQTTWSDPVSSARIGDEIVFRFYFHNGMIDTTAHNVVLRTNIPQTDSNSIHVNSYLSSDETAVINDTVVDNHIVGYGQGFSEINLSNSGHLEYVAGSTKIWRHTPNQWGTALPDGIASNNGLNIGSLNGCWDYAGYVTFKTKVIAAPTPAQLVLNKYVSSLNSGNWQKSLSGAHEGDTVSYKVLLSDTGELAANNITAKDVLPAGTSYINGSTKLYTPENPNGQVQADTLTTTGIYIQSVAAGSNNSIYLTFNARINSGLTYGANGLATLTNTAQAIFNNQTLSDTAIVYVSGNSGLTIQKKVWNGSSWVEQNQVKLGDRVKYQITVNNTGQLSLNSLTVADVIPVYTKYITGSTYLNGNAYQDGIATTSGLNLGSLARDSQLVLIFEVQTYGCPPVGSYTLLNTAYASASGINSLSDTASTIMNLVPISGPNVNQL